MIAFLTIFLFYYSDMDLYYSESQVFFISDYFQYIDNFIINIQTIVDTYVMIGYNYLLYAIELWYRYARIYELFDLGYYYLT